MPRIEMQIIAAFLLWIDARFQRLLNRPGRNLVGIVAALWDHVHREGGEAVYYYLLIVIVGIERLIGLVAAHRNAKWAIAQGGKELGLDHYPAMVSMHALLLVSCLVEVWALGRPFIPWLGWPMVAVVVLSCVIRWRCAAALGRHWNPRLIVIPGAPLVRHGPYRWVRHPDYIAVVAEVAALPLIHSAWLTAMVFTLANALVLHERIRLENAALAYV